LTTVGGGTTNIQANMLFNVSQNIGGLTTSGGPYTVTGTGATSINISQTNAGANTLTVTPIVGYADTTSALYSGMPVYFSGESLGGVSLNTVYYVNAIVGSTITLSEDVGHTTTFDITSSDIGSMTGAGESYVTVSNTLSSATASSDGVTLNQAIGTPAQFNVSSLLGGYTNSVTVAGSSYAVNNVITIPGTDLGGVHPENDLTLAVLTVNSTGGITSAIATGTPAGLENKYYLKVINEDQVEVYSDPNMKVAVSGQNFPYQGATTTTATSINGTNEQITVTSSADFVVNDAVVFTGDVFGGANLVLAQTYYIASKPSATTVTISDTIGGSAVNLTTSTGTMTMAKSGDYAQLPQPFYFSPSIVKYNNNVYECVVSNNDTDFILGKWELLLSGSNKLNALDRIVGYYKPNKTDTAAWNQYINMPGDDLTQLVSGITYPNSTYMGNAFPPAEEYTLDTILTDQPFYPMDVNLTGVIWNGLAYYSVADNPTTSSVNISQDSIDWMMKQLTNTPIGVSDFIYADEKYVVTSTNNATPILVSNNGVEWDSTITYVPISTNDIATISMNSVAYNNGVYVAVGSNVIQSTDLSTWTEVYKFPGQVLSNTFRGVTYASTTGFTGFVAVGFGQRFVASQATNTGIIYASNANGTAWSNTDFVATIYGLNAVASNGQVIVAVGDNGIIYTSFNTTTWIAQSSSVSDNLNSVMWDSYNNIFVAVGDNGAIITAPADGGLYGGTWSVTGSGVTTEDLEAVVYNDTDVEYVIVGSNNTVVRSSDAITWTSSSMFETNPTVYNVQGDTFTAGYGPEEMVPGVVSDTLTMITATRPGTNWDETIYQHVGYNVVSLELTPTSGSQTEYSFANVVETPAQISVSVIDYATGLGTSIYEGTSYSINWVTKTVILNQPLPYLPSANRLRIDVYETGNGDQLVKANTETDPIRLNTVTGFQEIYVNANYTADIYQGSGVIRPTTEPQQVTATSTNEITNAITCDTVEHFVLNGAITFSGAVFGGIVEDQVYYVKSISYISNRITISDVYNTSTGTAGATFPLTVGSGSMEVIIQVGTGTVWTPPIVYHNGSKLVLGHSATVTRTRSGTNTITTITTGDLVVDQAIKFSDTIFGGIVPLQTYYIKELYDNNEFTISETVGGAEFELTDETGGAIFVSADYAIGLAENGISASILLANEYDTTVDYITYTLFGQTLPVQYGYTIPETQQYTATAGQTEFELLNYVGGSNPASAIVEKNGIRLINTTNYTINSTTNTLTLTSGASAYDVITVTSYNLTDRQYFATQYAITGNTVSAIANINNAIEQPSLTVICSSTIGGASDYIVCGSTVGLSSLLNQEIIFKSSTPSTNFGGSGIDTTGKVYYVKAVISSTEFTISETPGGAAVNLTTATTSMVGYVGGNVAVRVTTSVNSLVTNDIIRIDGVVGSVQLNNNTYYVKKISDTQFYLYGSEYLPALNAVNDPITFASSYVSGGYVWLDESYIVAGTTTIATTASNNRVAVGDATGIVPGTPIYFNVQGSIVGENILGNILSKTEYFVLDSTPETGVSDIVVGYDYEIATLGSTSQLQWNTIAGTSGITYLAGDIIRNVASVGSGTGTVFSLQEFTISQQRYPDEAVFALANDTGTVSVSQFQQVNVDRLWVTINGKRVPSSALRINEYNNLSILSPISASDTVTITSMMPTATPNEEVYLLNVSTTNQASVYRANTQTRTWLVHPLSYTDSVIRLNDASRITDTIVQNVTTPAAVNGTYTIGLTSNKNVICHLVIYNNTTSSYVDPANYSITTVDTAPIVVITAGVSVGNSLTITSVEGRLLYINGEQIAFNECDLETNTVSGLTRGANGTGEQTYIPLYSEVFGIIPNNRMSDVVYSTTWNSNIYNTVDGDPLQISQTVGANFLKVDRS
jgi:hypothetical protein